ncbi:MAG: hypothetical protein AAFY51_06195 [Pseudomonadota bacterium]
MGLDLCVEGRAKSGHEAEWESIVRRSFADEELSDTEIDRFELISEPAYASLNAPRVGTDPAADDWIAAQMADRMTRDEAIEEYAGYHALALIENDGLPKFTHAGLYEGVDETSFRGKWLESCTSILSKKMVEEAWNHRMPDEAVAYGKSLLTAAADARNGKTQPLRKPSLLRKLFGSVPESIPLDEQLVVVETAGRWFVFWGSRGHAIRAYY